MSESTPTMTTTPPRGPLPPSLLTDDQRGAIYQTWDDTPGASFNDLMIDVEKAVREALRAQAASVEAVAQCGDDDGDITGVAGPLPETGWDNLPGESATKGMNLGQRIAHVGGRTNAAGYIEFGSEMAVDALIRHVLRDLPPTPAHIPADVEALRQLVKEAPIYFAPQYDFEGRKREWVARADALLKAHPPQAPQAVVEDAPTLPLSMESDIFNDWMEAAGVHVNNDGDIVGEVTDADVRQLMRDMWRRALATKGRQS